MGMLQSPFRWLLVAVPAALAACSSAPRANDPSGEDGAGSTSTEPLPTAMAIESEVGALDRGKVKATFRDAMDDMDRCVKRGRERLALLGGAIEAVVRVDSDGGVLWAYLLQSDLGDHRTEACILDVLKDRTWPRPSGGREGEATQQLDFGDPEERPPVPWSQADLGAKFDPVARSLRDCRRRAGAGPLDVTFYVNPSGRALAAGLAVADAKGNDAIDCVVRAVKGGRFPSPGSYPAKVTVEVD